MDLQHLAQELNPEQYKAVTAIDGALLIIAGAGSGKTRVITYRIAHMLDMGIPQGQILALTFTNKAAREMEERIKKLTGRKLRNLAISTFHAFGVQILRKHIEKLGWRENFSIYDETDRSALIKETGREMGFTADALDVYKIGNLFSDIKTGRKNWNGANDMYRGLYEGYKEGLRLFNAVDFDDLIVLPIKLFQERPDVLDEYREHYRYVMVDEFQDTSRRQYELMKLIACKNVAVVGDDDQSIYSWRGADYRNIAEFESDFPDVREIRLEQNYRSTGTILAAANGVISHNTNRKEKHLWSASGGGKPIEIFLPENEADEADFIVESIQGIAMMEHLKYDSFAIVMRANTQSRPIEEALLNSNIPYTMSGGTSFYERKEIKDIISYLRIISNRDDDVNMLRIINTPRRGIGRALIDAINTKARELDSPLYEAVSHLAKDENSPITQAQRESLLSFMSIIEANSSMIGGHGLAKKVRALVEGLGYWEYLVSEYQKSEKAARFKYLNIERLIQSIESWENDPDNDNANLYTYLNRITLLSRDDMDTGEADKGKVNMMTIHAAKGLEFPVVFIAGAEEGLMPHARALEEGDNALEEERRLFYVAITRARQKLLISSCRHRRRMQAVSECEPSRFLDEIPASLVEYHEAQKEVETDRAVDILERMKHRFS